MQLLIVWLGSLPFKFNLFSFFFHFSNNHMLIKFSVQLQYRQWQNKIEFRVEFIITIHVYIIWVWTILFTVMFHPNPFIIVHDPVPSYQVVAVIWLYLTPLLIITMTSVARSHSTNNTHTHTHTYPMVYMVVFFISGPFLRLIDPCIYALFC